MSEDPLKETIKIMTKLLLLEALILLFLKHGREWISKIQNLTIMAITFMKSSQKLTKWKIWLPFPQDKDKYPAEDKRLVRASERTIACNGLAGRHASIVSPLKIQKIFLNMVEIIFSKHKDPRIER